MAHKLVIDMSIERFWAWQDLLNSDRELSHQVGVLAVRGEGETFKPGVLQSDLPLSRDPDYAAMQTYPDGLAFGYAYEASVWSVTGGESNIALGHYACLIVSDNDVSLGALRPKVNELMAARQAQAAAVEPPPEAQAGVA